MPSCYQYMPSNTKYETFVYIRAHPTTLHLYSIIPPRYSADMPAIRRNTKNLCVVNSHHNGTANRLPCSHPGCGRFFNRMSSRTQHIQRFHPEPSSDPIDPNRHPSPGAQAEARRGPRPHVDLLSSPRHLDLDIDMSLPDITSHKASSSSLSSSPSPSPNINHRGHSPRRLTPSRYHPQDEHSAGSQASSSEQN